jgi:ArsR family transcriptional regulator, arsenate/arsenite/antimonite-responsive transcriptional repressor
LVAMKLANAAAQLEALGNPTRLGIYRTLVRVGQSGLPVGQLQASLRIAPSTLSHHLQKLVQFDLVTQERQGTTLICRELSRHASAGWISNRRMLHRGDGEILSAHCRVIFAALFESRPIGARASSC